MDDFEAKYQMVITSLSISRCCNEVLLELTAQLEGNNLNNAQYNRREPLETDPMTSDTANDVLEQCVCQVLLLTGISFELDEIKTKLLSNLNAESIIMLFQIVKPYKIKVLILIN